MKRIYFDNAATTKPSKRVLKAIKPFLKSTYGNPSSLHKEGVEAQKGIKKARLQVASALRCKENEIFFVSGASEANSIIASSAPYLMTDGDNHISLEAKANIKNYSEDETWLGLSLINNETGNYGALYRNNYEHNEFEWIHVDLTQCIGKMNINLKENKQVVSASFSGHKFGGLKGSGVLFVREEFQNKIKPIIFGHQEQGLRGGTENVVGIVALGEAIVEANKNINKRKEKVEKIEKYIYDRLKDKVRIKYSNGIMNITFKNVKGSSAVLLLDKKGVAVSSGSACSSGIDEPSIPLILDGYLPSEALSTIRLSFGINNTLKEAKKFCKIISKIIDKLDT